ncbi:hypothetical protein MRX96_011405 [Rhipicephalus microplus]
MHHMRQRRPPRYVRASTRNTKEVPCVRTRARTPLGGYKRVSPLVLGGVSSARKARHGGRIHRRFLRTLRKELFARARRSARSVAPEKATTTEGCKSLADGSTQAWTTNLPGRAVNGGPLFSTDPRAVKGAPTPESLAGLREMSALLGRGSGPSAGASRILRAPFRQPRELSFSAQFSWSVSRGTTEQTRRG